MVRNYLLDSNFALCEYCIRSIEQTYRLRVARRSGRTLNLSGAKGRLDMNRNPVIDLNSHVNQTKVVGSAADFPLTFAQAMYTNPITGLVAPVPGRQVVTRADNGNA